MFNVNRLPVRSRVDLPYCLLRSTTSRFDADVKSNQSPHKLRHRREKKRGAACSKVEAREAPDTTNTAAVVSGEPCFDCVMLHTLHVHGQCNAYVSSSKLCLPAQSPAAHVTTRSEHGHLTVNQQVKANSLSPNAAKTDLFNLIKVLRWG